MNNVRQNPEPHETLLQAALQEYLERVDNGEAVDRDEFLARHPQIADELRSFIDTSEGIQQMIRMHTDQRGPEDAADVTTHSFAHHSEETIPPRRTDREDQPNELGKQFGRYRILGTLGRGAMGTVHLAEDTQLLRRVALKTPHFEEADGDEILQRFYREARVAATLRHPNICPVYDVGEIDGRHYISMAYIEGRMLSNYIVPSSPQSERNIVVIVRKIARAVQHAHDHGIVHRDLKPANVMIDGRGEPIIMDFGLAHQTTSDSQLRLTRSGMLVGSPAYMSPEQVEGDLTKLGPATDQYSLGVMLYEMLTGQLPFQGTLAAVLGQIVVKQPKPPSELRPGLDPRLEAVCLRMMEKAPSRRFASLAKVADELTAILRNPPEAASPSPGSAPSEPNANILVDDRTSKVPPTVRLETTPPAEITQSNLESLALLARKLLAKHDYEQVVQMLEQVPEDRQNDEIRALLERARSLFDEVAFLLTEIDEAVRLRDGGTALRKAERLLELKPGNQRALQVQEQIRRRRTSSKPRDSRGSTILGRAIGEGSWFPWVAVAVGLLAFAGMYAAVVMYLRIGDALVKVSINDPEIKVGLQGRTLTIESSRDPVRVDAGEGNSLTIRYGDLEFTTDRFTLNKGDNPAVVVELMDAKLSARFGDQLLGQKTVPRKTVPSDVLANKNATQRVDANRAAAQPGQPDVAQERQIAEWVLSVDGRLRVELQDGRIVAVDHPGDIPNEPFRVDFVFLGFGSRYVPADVKRLAGLSGVREVQLERYAGWDDDVILPFRGMPRLEAFKLRGESRLTGIGLVALEGCAALHTLELNVCQLTDAACETIRRMPALRQLEFNSPHVTVRGFETLSKMTNLEALILSGMKLSAEAAAHIKRVKNLRHLHCDGVTDDAMSHIGEMTNLVELWLFRANVTDAGLKSTANLRKLTSLVVEDAPIHGSGLEPLRMLPSLNQVDLPGTDIDDGALQTFAQMPRLRHLSISKSRITDAGVSHLTNLGEILQLNLSGTRVSDASVAHLEKLKSLKNLDLTETLVTQAGLVRLRASLPDCTIIPASVTSKPPKEALKATVMPADGWIDLFNGRDLTGWKSIGGQGGAIVQNGVLVLTADVGPAWIGTEREYSDYELELEYRLQPGGNSGVFLRAFDKVDPGGAEFVEIQLLDDTAKQYRNVQNWQKNGAVYGIIPPSARSNAPPSQWNSLSVKAVGPRIAVVVNGKEIINGNLHGFEIQKSVHPDIDRRSGRIGLQRHGSQVEFRNIRIRELTGNSNGVEGAGRNSHPLDETVLLFDGTSLKGWSLVMNKNSKKTLAETWTANPDRNVLISLGGDWNDLATNGLYADFRLSLEWRFAPGQKPSGNGSGIVVRSRGLNDIGFDPKGVEIDIRPNKGENGNIGTGCFIAYDSPLKNHRGSTDGKLPGNRHLGWIREPKLSATGEWNTTEVVCEGDRITVRVNGEVVNEGTGASTDPGHIVLRNQNTAAEFRNIRIQELAHRASTNTATAAPELAALKELPSNAYNSAPWLSPDGLTLYWQSKPPGQEQRWIWCAQRQHKDALFENPRKLIAGSDPTVSADGLELIFLDGGGLYTTTRVSTAAAFDRPRKITEFDGLGFLAAPCLSEDGLTLYADQGVGNGFGIVRFTRPTRRDKWSPPKNVSLTGTSNPNLRFVFVTDNGRRCFCCIPDRLRDKHSNSLVMFSSKDQGLTFDSPAFIEIPGSTVQGKFPRYLAATKELFFSSDFNEKGEAQLFVIRNFNPDTMTVPVR